MIVTTHRVSVKIPRIPGISLYTAMSGAGSHDSLISTSDVSEGEVVRQLDRWLAAVTKAIDEATR